MSRIAWPYAKALYQANIEAKNNNTEKDILLLKQIFSEEKKFLQILSSPYNQKQNVQLLTEGLSPLITNLCKTLAHNKRLALLPQIIDIFLELQKQDRGEIDITVTSTIPITKAISDKITKTFKSENKVNITNLIDHSIIGGIIIRVGNKILDLSLRHKLKKLQEISTREVLKCS